MDRKIFGARIKEFNGFIDKDNERPGTSWTVGMRKEYSDRTKN